MEESSFWNLLDILLPHFPKYSKRKQGKTPNGDTLASLRLSMALRYFAGGDAKDIGPVHGVHPNEVFISIRHVINAVHQSSEMAIKFPEYHNDQQLIADGFRRKSTVSFGNCVGAIDGILIWTHKPSTSELESLGYGPKKFFCGRKKKYGINMQAICDSAGRFIDYELKHPGASADYLAFTKRQQSLRKSNVVQHNTQANRSSSQACAYMATTLISTRTLCPFHLRQ